MTVPVIHAAWELLPGDRTPTAYVARPRDGAPRGGVLVIHEGFGLNRHIEWLCRRLAAEAGCAVVAPDLYHRLPDRVAADDDRDKAVAMLRSLPDAQVLDDCARALAHLRAQGVERVPGVVGFRIGGRYALLVAARHQVAGAVSYYGSGIDRGTFSALWTLDALAECGRVEAPMLLVFAGDDPTIPADEADRIERRLRELGRDADVVRYPGVKPGFLFPERPTYAPDEAGAAWERTRRFLDACLHRAGPWK